jgi:hypothetical protein
MHFDEGRVLNRSHYNQPENRKQIEPASATRRPSSAHKMQGGLGTSCRDHSESADLQAARMLDSANNKMQELMQLLYLLSRDPAVPNDARYHVTVAQGEIALLARVIRNKAEETTNDSLPAAETKSIPAVSPGR